MKPLARSIAAIIAITPSLVLFPQPASAGTIWDGGGADDNWGTGANWNDDLTPPVGPLVDLTFTGTTRLTPINNYTAFDDFHSLTFDAAAGSFSLTGSAIDIFGKIENLSTNAQTIGFDLAVNGGQAGTGEFNPVNGDLNINSANVFTNGNTLHVYGTNNKTVTFGATTVISQTGHFNVEQASNAVFLGNNTYTGTTNVLAGSLTVGDGGTTGTTGTGTVTVAAGATLTYNRSDAVTIGQALNIGGELVKNGAGALTISGPQAGITGTVAINAGRITMGANNSLGTAAITLNAGAIERNAAGQTVANAIAIGATGGTLLGRQVVDDYTTFSGQLTGSGPLTVQGLVVLSNAANTYAGNITISNASSSFLRLVGSDRIGSTSNVTLGGANASFRLDGTAVTQTIAALSGTAGRVFSVGSGAITLNVGNADASSSYAGTMDTGGGPLNLVKIGAGTLTLNKVATGNNAPLTSVTVNAGKLALVHTTDNFDRGYFTGTTPITINAGGTVDATRLWTIKSTNVVNVNGGTLNFSSPFSVNVSDTNYVNNLTLQNGATISGPGGFRVGNVAGPTLTMNSSGNSTNTISTNLFFIKNGGITTYSMNVADGTAPVDLDITGNINENPSFLGMVLNKAGAGNLRLAGTNTFGGATTITAGTLTLGAGGTTGTLTGSISNSATLAIDRSGSATIGNVISGAGVVNHVGTGTTTLTGANAYTGATTVSSGTLITTPAQTGATTVTVADGAAFGVKLNTAGTTFNIGTVTTGTTTGATLRFENGALVNPTAAMLSATTFTPTAATTLRVNGSNLAPGTFTLLDYAGSIGGTGFGGLTLALPFRVLGSLVDNSGNTSVDVTITGAETAKWQGNTNGDWDIDPDGGNTAGTVNWKTSLFSTATRYAQGATNTDSATFDDTATGTTTVNLTTTLTPVGTTVNNTTLNYTFGGAGKLSGATGLTKQGNGKLTLVNTTAYDYTGGTTISGGILELGDGATAGAGAISGAITNNATLAINRPDDVTLASGMSGTGAVVKLGAGATTITGSNSYSGGTTVSAGRLLGTTNTAFGTGPIVIGDTTANASLYLGQRADITNAITVSPLGSGTVIIGADNTGSGANASTFGGTLTLNRPTTLSGEVTGDRLAIDGQITGTVGTLTVSGGARTTFQSTASDFVGDIVIAGAGTILQASVATAAETIPNGSSVTIDSGAFLQLASLSGAETINALNGSGTVRTFPTGNYGSGLIVGSAGGSGNFIGVLQNGTIGNPLSLTKTGVGTQTLGGVNTYTGPTILSGGTLAITGSISGSTTIDVQSNANLDVTGASGGFIVAAGQTLKGNGNVLGATTVNGTLSPGASPGTLTFDNALIFGSTSALTLEIGGTNPGEFDKVAGVTNLTLDGTFTVSLFSGFSPVPGNSFDVLDWSGSLDITGFNVGTDLILPSLSLDYTWDATNFTSNGTLAVVPEPGAAISLILGIGALVSIRRRR